MKFARAQLLAMWLVMSIGAHAASLVDTNFNNGVGFDSWVEHAIEQPDGKILAGGGFQHYNGEEIKFLIRLNPDGSVDRSFNVTVNGWVRHFTLQPDGKIIVGGYFTIVNDVVRRLIVRLNSDGTVDMTFDPGRGFEEYLAESINHETLPFVFWQELQTDGKLVVCGNFKTCDGQSNNGIARLNTDGSRDSTFNVGSGLDVWGRSIRVLDNGQILLTGWFNNYNGRSFNRIVRLNPDGTADTTFNAYYGDKTAVYSAVALPDGKYITAGHSLNDAGLFKREVVRINNDGSVDSSWPGKTNEKTECLLLQPDGKLLLSGYFWAVDDQSPYACIARMNADGSVDTTFQAQADNFIWNMSMTHDRKILCAGWFTSIDGIPVKSLARLSLPENLAQTPSEIRIASARMNGSKFECSVDSANGITYTLQFKTVVSSPEWTALPAVSGNGGTIILADPNPDQERFYRIEAH